LRLLLLILHYSSSSLSSSSSLLLTHSPLPPLRYAAIKWPTESDIGAFKDGNDAAIETAAADWQATAASAAAMAEESLARIAELEELVALMESKKVGVNTTTEDIFEAYPEIEADIIEDLNAHKWSKDV